LRRAVELKAYNPVAWFDYGQAFELSRDSREAHKAYHKVSEIAEQAHTGLAKK